MHWTLLRQSKRLGTLLLLCGMLGMAFSAEAQVRETNSNLWPVYRDSDLHFRISYPPSWKVGPPKGPNVRFSVFPPSPPGNCNVVVVQKSELSGLDQIALNAEVQSLGLEVADWAGYIGASPSSIRLLSSRSASVAGVDAIVAVVEADLQNLQGAFMRKQMVALFLHRGAVWTLNCGASDGNIKRVRTRYDELSSTFSKVFGSVALGAATISGSPAAGESLSPAQIKQIEEIAQSIAAQHNANAKSLVDDMTVSTRATAVGRNVRIENVLRVKKGLPTAKLKEFSDETRREIVPKACAANANNSAFGRGLTYTFGYKNTYGERLAEFTVDQALCRTLR